MINTRIVCWTTEIQLFNQKKLIKVMVKPNDSYVRDWSVVSKPSWNSIETCKIQIFVFCLFLWNINWFALATNSFFSLCEWWVFYEQPLQQTNRLWHSKHDQFRYLEIFYSFFESLKYIFIFRYNESTLQAYQPMKIWFVCWLCSGDCWNTLI